MMFTKQLLLKPASTGNSPMMTAMVARRCFGGGGHAIVKADGNHAFVAPCNKKTIAFDGLKPTANQVHEISNPYRHQNDLPMLK